MYKSELNEYKYFQMSDHSINTEKMVKLLGVHIDDKLNFSHRASTIDL